MVKYDDTTSNDKIPQTGINDTTLFIAILVAGFSTFAIIRIRKFKDMK